MKYDVSMQQMHLTNIYIEFKAVLRENTLFDQLWKIIVMKNLKSTISILSPHLSWLHIIMVIRQNQKEQNMTLSLHTFAHINKQRSI